MQGSSGSRDGHHCEFKSSSAQPAQAGAFELAKLIAGGSPSQEASSWISKGLRAWLTGKGAISLERALGLPTTWKKWARTERNRLICSAWSYCDAETGPERVGEIFRAFGLAQARQRGSLPAPSQGSDRGAIKSRLLFEAAKMTAEAGLVGDLTEERIRQLLSGQKISARNLAGSVEE